MPGAKGRSGGLRSGAGRKPATARILALHGGRDRGVKRPQAVEAAVVAVPDGLPEDVSAVWLDLAPHATTAGTLIPSMVPAFLRLCRAVVKHARWEAQIATDGDTYLKVTIDGAGTEHTEVKAHPLIGKSQTLDNQIRGWFKDFGINPFGKPLTAPAKAEDPFEEFG